MENLYSQENLEKLLQECYDEIEKGLDKYYLEYFNFKKDGIRIQAKDTTGKVLGNCHYDSMTFDYDYWGKKYIKSVDRATITIFRHLNRDTKGVKETIIHELIHTLKGCQNHRAEFKRHCAIIKQYLGYSCYSGQHEDVKSAEYLDNFKHFLICEHCHKVVSRGNRYTVVYRHPENCRCKSCKTTTKYMTLREVKEWL